MAELSEQEIIIRAASFGAQGAMNMTVRDIIAMNVLNGYMACSTIEANNDVMCKSAYMVADRMLKAKFRTQV